VFVACAAFELATIVRVPVFLSPVAWLHPVMNSLHLAFLVLPCSRL
jgi:hypothetical protein